MANAVSARSAASCSRWQTSSSCACSIGAGKCCAIISCNAVIRASLLRLLRSVCPHACTPSRSNMACSDRHLATSLRSFVSALMTLPPALRVAAARMSCWRPSRVPITSSVACCLASMRAAGSDPAASSAVSVASLISALYLAQCSFCRRLSFGPVSRSDPHPEASRVTVV